MSLKDTINSKIVEVLKARTGKERILTKKIQSGDSVDMEVLEKFMPISRDFSDDF